MSMALMSGAALAEEAGSRKGHGHFGVGYQYIHVDGFESSIGELPIGTVDTHTIIFDVEYYLTDRWTLMADIPIVRKRYQGPGPHDPLALDPPKPNVKNVDDGKYRTTWQDIHLGVRYLAKTGPLEIEPFIALGVPSNDYPFFGHAAAGQNLVKLDVGSRFAYRPPISDAFYSAEISYVFIEETLGQSIDHWRIHADAGYIFSDRMSARVFTIFTKGNGLSFPDDFPPPRTTEKWYQHDRLVKHNYGNVGIGVDWLASEKIQVSTAAMTMVWADQVHDLEYALIVAVNFSF